MRSPGVLVASLVLLAAAPARGVDEVIDSVMDRDPDVPTARQVFLFQKDLPTVWATALGLPEADTRCQAATAIAMGKKRGVPGLEATVPALKRELDKDDQHPLVRLAVAKALAALDVKDVAPRFHALSAAAAPELRDVLVPALAAWDYKPARSDWRARIGSIDTRHRFTLLAIQALGTVKDEESAPRLKELALNTSESGPVRIEAALALSLIRTSGLEKDARSLAAEPAARKIVDRLVAATLLRRHSGPDAVAVLQTIARDPEPAVAAVAVRRLIDLDPNTVLSLLNSVLASSDANVRGLGVEVLIRLPSAESIAKLADATNDPHPAVCVQARKGLQSLAGKAHRPAVLKEATRILAGSDWRGLEQTAILMAQLDHKPAAPRLVEVLPVDRGETAVAVAWALRKLDVPETLPGVHDYVKALIGQVNRKGGFTGRTAVSAADLDLHVSQLFQFIGARLYRPAEDVQREVVPPNALGFEARAAAVWGLGRMHEGKADPALTRMFIGRLTAQSPFDFESVPVRKMSAIALGRMKAKDAVGPLRQFFVAGEYNLDTINNACGWALEQITGEKLKPPGVVEGFDLDWFLRPAK